MKLIISLNLKSFFGFFYYLLAMVAKYILPKSKDMPYTDEYESFDKVFSNLLYAFYCCDCQSYDNTKASFVFEGYFCRTEPRRV